MQKKFENVPKEIPFGSEEFRQYFRTHMVNNLPAGNYYLTTYVISLTIIIACLVDFLEVKSFFELLSVPFYFLFCNFFEYLFHRFPMHQKVKFMKAVYHHVTIHHNFYANDLYYYENPNDYYAVLIPYYVWIHVVISSCVLGLIVYAIFGYNQAILFLVTVSSYYLIYEFLHFSYHARADSWIKKIPLVKSLSRFHLVHHSTDKMAKFNFNITFPIFDTIFGTLYRGEGIVGDGVSAHSHSPRHS
jgi:sterol desaturase/sphingolipid hydroxylase (fatty acid hydroxylase superfamily)